MTNTIRKNLFLTLTAFVLAAISAACLFMIAPDRSVKADEELPSQSSYVRITEGTITNLVGKYIAVKSRLVTPEEDFSLDEPCMCIDVNPVVMISDSEGTVVLHIASSSSTIYVFSSIDCGDPPAALVAEAAEFSDLEGDYLAIYIPQTVTTMVGEVIDIESAIFNIDPTNYDKIFFYEFSETVNEPTEDLIEDPTENPVENPTEDPADTPTDNPTENTTDEKKSFDIGEWIHNAGEEVSAWLGDNVGIATTGSTVLIVAAVIILVMILRRRR